MSTDSPIAMGRRGTWWGDAVRNRKGATDAPQRKRIKKRKQTTKQVEVILVYLSFF